ncbi:MAG: hypothetical protein H7235_01465 [Bdellovibrionaceae bacterium]|nr:hypothetical protein [Pseudobdellovibrionaceae bacterium]
MEIKEAEEFLNFSDTIKFAKSTNFRVKSLDCFSYEIKDTVSVPKLTLLIDADRILLARKLDDEYYISQFELGGRVDVEYNPERINFLNTGKEQLLLKWFSQSGNAHFKDYSEGFIIIDTENMNIVANFTNYIDHAVWDENDKMVEDCYNFIPQINNREIIFTQDNKCGEKKSKQTKRPIKISYKAVENELIKVSAEN